MFGGMGGEPDGAAGSGPALSWGWSTEGVQSSLQAVSLPSGWDCTSLRGWCEVSEDHRQAQLGFPAPPLHGSCLSGRPWGDVTLLAHGAQQSRFPAAWPPTPATYMHAPCSLSTFTSPPPQPLLSPQIIDSLEEAKHHDLGESPVCGNSLVLNPN